jgi:hypothetical protein
VTPKKQPPTAKEVLGHFVRNPQAADTLEGIARWRLLRETVFRSLEETAEALDWLVAEGFLNETSTTYSKPIYSLNTQAIDEAKELLAEEGSPERPRDNSEKEGA